VVPGPYGPRRVTYADYTASGRALGFLEDFIALCLSEDFAHFRWFDLPPARLSPPTKG